MELKLKRVLVRFDVDKTSAQRFDSHYGLQTARRLETKNYTYITDLDLKAEDFVVVDSPTAGLTVARVTEVSELSHIPNNLKYIISRVDVDGYKEREKMRARYFELHGELTRRAKAARERLDFREVLGEDAEAMKLVEELESLRVFA